MCRLLRVGGIYCLGLTLPIVAILTPTLPVNLYSYPPGLHLMNCVKYILVDHPTLSCFVEKTILFIANYLMWLIHVKLILVSTIEKILGSLCLTLCVLQFHKRLQAKNCIGKKSCTLYRTIQMLTAMFNEVERFQLLAILGTIGSAQVAAGLRLLGSDTDQLNTADIESSMMKIVAEYWVDGFHFLIWVNTMVVINFTFGYCAQLHDSSKNVLNDLRRNSYIKALIVNLKTVRSFPKVSVKFGGTNFIDKMTPVVFQMFLVARLIDMLLVKRKK